MNRKKYIIALLAAVALIIIGCIIWWLNRGGGQRDVVPDDAVSAMRLDVRQLIKLADIDKDKLSEVDNTTGLEIGENIYGFITQDGNVGMSAAIANADDFDSHLSGKRNRAGFTYGMLGSFMACHDGDKVLLMGPMANMNDEALMDQMARLMDKDQCTLALLDSAELSEDPLSIRTSVNALPKRLRDILLPSSMKSLPDDALQLQIGGAINNNKISMHAHLVTSSDGIKKHLQDIFSSLKPLTGSLVHEAPQDPIIWLAVGVNGEKIIDVLRSNANIRTALLAANMYVDLDMMIKAINGDVQLSVPTLTLRRHEWIIDAQVDNDNFMNNAKDWDQSKLQTYFGMEAPGVLYATNSMHLMQLAYTTTPNTGLMLQMKQIQGAYIYATVNLKPLVNTIAPALAILGYGSSFYQTFDNLNSLNFRMDNHDATLEIVLDKNLCDILKK